MDRGVYIHYKESVLDTSIVLFKDLYTEHPNDLKSFVNYLSDAESNTKKQSSFVPRNKIETEMIVSIFQQHTHVNLSSNFRGISVSQKFAKALLTSIGGDRFGRSKMDYDDKDAKMRDFDSGRKIEIPLDPDFTSILIRYYDIKFGRNSKPEISVTDVDGDEEMISLEDFNFARQIDAYIINRLRITNPAEFVAFKPSNTINDASGESLDIQLSKLKFITLFNPKADVNLLNDQRTEIGISLIAAQRLREAMLIQEQLEKNLGDKKRSNESSINSSRIHLPPVLNLTNPSATTSTNNNNQEKINIVKLENAFKRLIVIKEETINFLNRAMENDKHVREDQRMLKNRLDMIINDLMKK